MEIEFSGQYDKKLLKRAIALAFPPSRIAQVFSYVLLGGFIFLAGWAIRDYLGGKPVTFVELAGLILPLVVIAYFIVQRYRQPGTLAAELWGDPAARGSVTGRVTPHGVTMLVSTPHGASERLTPWERFTRIRTDEEITVLVTDSGVLFTFPRGFFAGQEEWSRFQQLAQSRVVEAR